MNSRQKRTKAMTIEKAVAMAKALAIVRILGAPSSAELNLCNRTTPYSGVLKEKIEVRQD